MHEIDFLPVQYRQKHVQRQSQPWRVVVVAVFLVLLAAAVVAQRGRQRAAEKELAETLPQYDMAVSQNRRLAEIDAELSTVRDTAELLTYLRHPWPRTQLLAALLTPLPEEIGFEDLRISCETSQDRVPHKRPGRNEETAEEQELAKLSPAARDLKQLREEFDQGHTVVTVSGTSSHSAAVHRYLGELNRMSLFTAAEPDWIEAADDQPAGTLRFRATVVVRPGYGQPGGPIGPQEEEGVGCIPPGRPEGCFAQDALDPFFGIEQRGH